MINRNIPNPFRSRLAAHALMVVLALGAFSDSLARSIEGIPDVIDGDSIRIQGVVVRLHGMDAPELDQTCLDADDQRWACGKQAKAALEEIIGDNSVRCRRAVHHPRYVGDCRIGDRRISAEMLRSGWAVVDRRGSRKYIGDESTARRESLNLWSGSFEKPWNWRKDGRRASAAGFVLFDVRSVTD